MTQSEVINLIRKKRIRIHAFTIARTILYSIVIAIDIIGAKIGVEKGHYIMFIGLATASVLFFVAWALFLSQSNSLLSTLDKIEAVVKRNNCQSFLESAIRVIEDM